MVMILIKETSDGKINLTVFDTGGQRSHRDQLFRNKLWLPGGIIWTE